MTSDVLTRTVSGLTEQSVAPGLRRLLVAHDGSAAAEKAFKDATSLARRFQAEITMAYIEAHGPKARSERERDWDVAAICDLEEMRTRLAADGIRSRVLFREGSVAEALLRLCEEEQTELLLLGAYGHGDTERQTLGSTAEHLLRTITCPVVIYGPDVRSSLLSNEYAGPALLPIALPCAECALVGAVSLAKLLGVSVELFHSVMNRDAPHELRWFEGECRSAAAKLRRSGIRTEWSFLYGPPDATILAKSSEVHSPFLLMPLKRRSTLSAAESDNVAANVIRRSRVPVITYLKES